MKKINLFNRHTNSPRGCREQSPLSMGKGCPVERGGVWACWRNAPRITPSPFGATPSWKEGERSGRGGLWFAALVALFIATPSFAEPSELDKKTVASKAYVDTKQDLIDSGNVLLDNFDDNNVYVPGLVAYDSTTQTLKGNQVGILDWVTLDTVGMVLDDYSDRDDLVPTVAAVSQVLSTMWNNMSQQWQALSWNVNNDNGANRINAINAYNSTFGNGTNQWSGVGAHLIDGQFLANSLALKQNKLPEQDDNLIPGQAGSVLAPTTAGNVAQVALWNADGGDSTAWIIDDYYTDTSDRAEIRGSIPTVGAVEVGLEQKQNKMTCAGWDSETHTDEHCWLWSIAE